MKKLIIAMTILLTSCSASSISYEQMLEAERVCLNMGGLRNVDITTTYGFRAKCNDTSVVIMRIVLPEVTK